MGRVAHGHARYGKVSATYKSWNSMLARCVHSGHEERKPDYSGVNVCSRWNPQEGGSFENFLADMGERPESTTLGRFADTGNYEPSNCKWMTDAEQKAEAQVRNNIKPRKIALTGAKLTTEQVSAIHDLRAQGMLLREIAAQYGVHIMTVSDITRGKAWKNLSRSAA